MNIISLFVDAANRDAGSGECRVRETAFTMFLIAAGLVAGLLLANVALRPRKAL